MKTEFICKTCNSKFIAPVQKGYNTNWCSKKCRHDYLTQSMVGRKFGDLTIIKEVEPKIFKRKQQLEIIKMVECKCDCGKVCNMAATRIKNGRIKSCGCRRSNTYKINCDQTKHGLFYHPLHNIWAAMKQRCYDVNVKPYKNYGGRGIIVWEEWKNDFKLFYNWAIANGWQKGLQIDRIDNDGIYAPSNCRFVERRINCNNRRTNRYVFVDNERIPLQLACDKFGLNGVIIYQRMQRNGWDFDKAVKR